MSNDTYYKVIDGATGEIVTEGISSWKTPIQEQIIKDYYKKKDNEYKRNRSKNPFVMCFIEPLKPIIHQLTLVECGSIMKLLPFIAMNKDGYLMKNKKEYLELSDIIEILGLSRRQTIRILSKLESMNIIFVHKLGRKNAYAFNERFHKRGGKNNKNFTKVLINGLNDYCRLTPLRELGFIYKSLPFVSYQTLTLCSNPNEEDVEKLIPLSRNKLAELTNCNVDTLTDVVKKLEERRLLASMPEGRSNKYYISSKIVYRLADDSTTSEISETDDILKFSKRLKEHNATNILDLFFGISNKK